MPFIEVNHICKDYRIYKQTKGVVSFIKSLAHREYTVIHAVKDISYSVDKGEIVGYIGPNGAGKSTMIKMLCGIILPSSGEILIDGKEPYKNRRENAMKIGVVFGQRSQLYWDLPMSETFSLYKKMYKVDDSVFRKNVNYFVEVLEMQSFIDQPIRQLSLGQKMRANIAIAFLHDPSIVFLDEPTIGLDVVAKSRIREFIQEVNKQKRTTIILTTHDMDDIEKTCKRLIMINKGQLVYNGELEKFKDSFSDSYSITIQYNSDVKILDRRLQIIKDEGTKKTILCKKDYLNIGEAVESLTYGNSIVDLTISQIEIEEIVKNIYERKG